MRVTGIHEQESLPIQSNQEGEVCVQVAAKRSLWHRSVLPLLYAKTRTDYLSLGVPPLWCAVAACLLNF